jgi:hypothetical protein
LEVGHRHRRRSTGGNPLLDQSNLLGIQRFLALGGHEFLVVMREGYPADQLAFRGLRHHQDRAALRSGNQGRVAVEPQTGLFLFRSVTGHTMLLEHRLDMRGIHTGRRRDGACGGG